MANLVLLPHERVILKLLIEELEADGAVKPDPVNPHRFQTLNLLKKILSSVQPATNKRSSAPLQPQQPKRMKTGTDNPSDSKTEVVGLRARRRTIRAPSVTSLHLSKRNAIKLVLGPCTQYFHVTGDAMGRNSTRINKDSEYEGLCLLHWWLENAPQIQVAYVQGLRALEGERGVRLLIKILMLGHCWAVNVGEVRMSTPLLRMFLDALPDTAVTHMFYCCEWAGPTNKRKMRSIIRSNRKKHDRWDCVRHPLARGVDKMWFNPRQHRRYQVWCYRLGVALVLMWLTRPICAVDGSPAGKRSGLSATWTVVMREVNSMYFPHDPTGRHRTGLRCNRHPTVHDGSKTVADQIRRARK